VYVVLYIRGVQLYFAILVANFILFFSPLFIVFSVTKGCINGLFFGEMIFVIGFTMFLCIKLLHNTINKRLTHLKKEKEKR
jgi:uncharacterized membrane protein YdjX (TVP38/TMEM64 family)